jgi:hypothetical protein
VYEKRACGKGTDRNPRHSWRPIGGGVPASRYDDHSATGTPTITPATSESEQSGSGGEVGCDAFGARREFHSFGGWRSQPLYAADSSSIGSSDCGDRRAPAVAAKSAELT